LAESAKHFEEQNDLLTDEIEVLKVQMSEREQAATLAIKKLKEQRDTAQDQLNSYLSQKSFEKDSDLSKLQVQVQQTIVQLDKKESECEEWEAQLIALA